MPELPEVETVKRGLEERILGLKIAEVKVLCDKSFVGEIDAVVGRVVENLRRFGKALIVDLSGGMSLMMHLRMTGQLIFDGVDDRQDTVLGDGDRSGGAMKTEVPGLKTEVPGRYAAGHPSENFVAKLPNKQTRVVIRFVDAKAGKAAGVLYFNDQRKFGFIKVLKTSEVEQEDFIRRLAKEPWEMTPEEFYAALQRHPKSMIKAVILDQGVISGLGNIYADESLFMAGIHPERRAGTITREEAEKLLLAAREVMTRSIESGGSTMATYVRADGTRGNYLEKFAQVFRREGKPCPKCGAEIVKIRVAGRGTHICPQCQVLGKAEKDGQEGKAARTKKAGAKSD